MPSTEEFQKFLDTHQYTTKGIKVYELIFGRTYVSTGGKDTTEKYTKGISLKIARKVPVCRFCQELPLKENCKVLDVGCGIGGSAFYMAETYGALVTGVDLSTNMVSIADGYRAQSAAGVKFRVQFHVEDATTMEYPRDFFDVIYSRDTILHIADKEALFRKFFSALKPGGVLLITDYCRGEGEGSQAFKEYVKQRGYNLLTVPEYGATLQRAGFSDVEAVDNTKYFIQILKDEMERFQPMREKVAKEYSAADFQYIVDG